MKKNTKSMLISALILFCAGLLLALGSALFVKIRGIDLYGVPYVSSLRENSELSLSSILAHSPESNFMKKLAKKEYARVSVDTFAGNVEITSTDGPTKIILENANTTNLNIQVIGETLTIEEVNSVGFMGIFMDRDGFSFKGLRQLFGSGNSAAFDQKIKIELSKDIPIDQLDVNTKSGNVVLSNLETELVNVSVAVGNVNINSLATSQGKLNVKGKFTNVELKNLKNVTTTVTVNVGDIHAEVGGSHAEFNTILDTFLGDISVITEDPTTSYKLSLITKFGNVLRNGKSFGSDHTDSSTTAKRITSNTIFGDISVSFAGGDESKYVSDDQNDTLTEEDEVATLDASPINPIV